MTIDAAVGEATSRSWVEYRVCLFSCCFCLIVASSTREPLQKCDRVSHSYGFRCIRLIVASSTRELRRKCDRFSGLNGFRSICLIVASSTREPLQKCDRFSRSYGIRCIFLFSINNISPCVTMRLRNSRCIAYHAATHSDCLGYPTKSPQGEDHVAHVRQECRRSKMSIIVKVVDAALLRAPTSKLRQRAKKKFFFPVKQGGIDSTYVSFKAIGIGTTAH